MVKTTFDAAAAPAAIREARNDGYGYGSWHGLLAPRLHNATRSRQESRDHATLDAVLTGLEEH